MTVAAALLVGAVVSAGGVVVVVVVPVTTLNRAFVKSKAPALLVPPALANSMLTSPLGVPFVTVTGTWVSQAVNSIWLVTDAAAGLSLVTATFSGLVPLTLHTTEDSPASLVELIFM